MTLPTDDALRWLAAIQAVAEEDDTGEPLTPVDEADLARVEAELGRELPADFRWWLTNVGWGALVGGDLSLHPLEPDEDDEASVATATAQLREWDWSIPDEVIVFAVNGGGDPFGLWLPAGGEGVPAVVQIGAGNAPDDPCMWILGDSFTGFMRGYLSLYSYWIGDPDWVNETLEIPVGVRRVDEDDPDYVELEGDEEDAVTSRVLQFTSPSLGQAVTGSWNDRRLSEADLAAVLNRP